jgi:dephospho-CoA kinase
MEAAALQSWDPNAPLRGRPRQEGGAVVIKVGLTGGIGSGKSEVSRLLAARGAVVVDADQLARAVVEPGSKGLVAVLAEFADAPELVRADGSLDRAAMGRLVFADPAALRRLEAIVHPMVAERAAELMAAAPQDAIVVYDVPLLVENGLQAGYDRIVVVDSDEPTRLRRLAARGLDTEDARARMAAQADRQQRLAAADYVVDNDGTLEDLDRSVEGLWSKLIALATARD